MLACLSGGVRRAVIALQPSLNAWLPKAANDNGLVWPFIPVPDGLVRRLLIELPMSSGWPYGPDDPDQQDCSDKAGNQVADPSTQVDAEGTQNRAGNRRADN